MSYAQIQSTLTVLIDVSLLLVPVLFIAYIAGLNQKVEVAEVKVAEPEVEVAEVKEVEPEVEVAEVKEVEPEVEVAEVKVAEPEVEVAEVKEVEPEVEVAEVKEVEPEALFLALEKNQAMKEETLMDMLDRVSEEVQLSINSWYEGGEMLTDPLELEEARLRFKKAEELVVSVELLGNREFFKVQKIARKYVYALNFEGVVCKLSLEGVKFWVA